MVTVARMRADGTPGGPGRGAWPGTSGAPVGGASRPVAVVLAVAGGLATVAASFVALQQSGPGPSLGTAVGSPVAPAGSLSRGPAPTLGQWVGEANAVCRSGLQGYAALARPTTPAQEVDYLRSVYTVARSVDLALGRIQAPTPGGRQTSGMVNGLETETRWIAGLANAIATGSGTGQATAVRQVNAAAAVAARSAQQLGATDCATMAGG